jgi:hypothetical protein
MPSLDELAGANRRGMADDGDEIALAARLHPQHAKAAVLVMERHPLDKAGEVLAVGGRMWRFHSRRPYSSIRLQMPFAHSLNNARLCQKPPSTALIEPSPERNAICQTLLRRLFWPRMRMLYGTWSGRSRAGRVGKTWTSNARPLCDSLHASHCTGLLQGC